MVVQTLAMGQQPTRFAAVRFGNGLGKVTVTHPDITRYCLTIPEATRLVIQTGARSSAGSIRNSATGSPGC